MPELCRNFQRGSCHYGDRCRFSHATQKSNPFGLGSQTSVQQQKPNPFGFGVQNNGSGGVKPFENKWIRPGQPANQSQATQSKSADHDCKDPAMCRRMITDDFQNERPLWKLSCYAHYKHLPCDISGDISYEELRAEAYNDAKRGLSIQAIIDKEKHLEKSKLMECENILRNPTNHTQSSPSNPSPFATVNTTFPSSTPQNTKPSPFSSFSPQQGSSPNMTFGTPQQGSSPNLTFGNPQQGSSPHNPFTSPTPQNTGPSFSGLNPQQGSSANMAFGVRPSTPSSTMPFAQSQGSGFFGSVGGQTTVASPFTSIPAQTSGNPFASSTTIFGKSGMNSQGNHATLQTGGNALTSNAPLFGNSGMGDQGSNLPSSFPVSPQQIHTPAYSQPSISSSGNGAAILGDQRDVIQKEVLPADASIWMKADWKLGEIPEQPPPSEYVK